MPDGSPDCGASEREVGCQPSIEHNGGDKPCTVVSEACTDDETPLPLSEMLRQVASVALPTTFNALLFFAGSVTTTIFVGQQLGVKLAQFGIGLLMFNVCGYSLGSGLSAALDTLASQAYGRNPTGPDVGDILQRAFLLNFIVAVPIIMFFMVAEPFLCFVFGEEIGSGAAVIMRCSPVTLIAQSVNIILARTLQAQKLAHLPLYATCVSTVLSPLYCALFVHRGLCWCMVAITLTNVTAATINACMCIWHPQCVVRNCKWPSPHLLDWGRFVAHVKIAFPAMCAMCSEWWGFDFLQIVAAQIGTREVAALGIVFNIATILFSIPCGFAQATSVLVGNSLGENKPRHAYAFFAFILRLLIVMATGTATLLFAFVRPFTRLFTDDVPTVDIVVYSVPLLVGFHLLDALQSTLQGVFRGTGRQDECATVVLLTLWFVGLPCAAVLALLVNMQFPGILAGFSLGLLLESPYLIWRILRWDWFALAAKASKKNTEAATAA